MEQRHREEAHAHEMFERVERFLASGLSQTEFCREEGLRYNPFRYWLKKYQLQGALSSSAIATSADFIPLRITPAEPAAPSSTCEIEFPSGVVVRFQGTVDPAVLAQLIRAEQAEP
jgi:hypothetical protein